MTYRTTALIPAKGVFITETYHPAGYNVATYDSEGLTSSNRWFDNLESAYRYAAKLDTMPPASPLSRQSEH